MTIRADSLRSAGRRWSGNRAILHDGQAYGKGLAEETRKRLNDRGIAEAMFEAIEPGKADYWDVVQKMRPRASRSCHFGGFPHEAGADHSPSARARLRATVAGGRWHQPEELRLRASVRRDADDLIRRAGEPAGRNSREGFPTSEPGHRFWTYGAFQVWAQAVETAGSFETKAVGQRCLATSSTPCSAESDFDAKGDVIGYETFVWHVWNDGQSAPMEPGKLTE